MGGYFSDIRTAIRGTSSATELCRRVRFSNDYRETRRKILENYSDPDLYTIASTQSGNVYVFREYYCQYLLGALNSDLRSKLEIEIKDAEIFGSEGYIVLILPERVILLGSEFSGRIPDALMNGMLLEFKNLKSVKYTQFKKQLKDGLAKADLVYVYLQDNNLIDNNEKKPIFNSVYGQTKGKDKYDGKKVIISVRGKNLEICAIKNGTPERVPLSRLGDLPQPNYNISSVSESVNDGGL